MFPASIAEIENQFSYVTTAGDRMPSIMSDSATATSKIQQERERKGENGNGPPASILSR
jgi:hypothetical protein